MRRTIIGTALLALAAPLATVTSGAASSATATTPPALGTIYVVNSDATAASILGYAPGATGNVAPVTDITGSAVVMNQPRDVVAAPDGSLWIGELTNAVLRFAAGATGNVAPIQDITGADTGIDHPAAVAVARDGSVWVANGQNSTVERFAADATGDAKPLQVISGTNTDIEAPGGIALTPDGQDIWVESDDTLAEWPVTASGNTTPIRQITGADTQLNGAYAGVYPALDGSLWTISEVGLGNTRLLHFSAGASGDAVPTVIVGGASQLTEPIGIAPDAAGHLWIPDLTASKVFELPANATVTSAPLNAIDGASTKLTEPWSVAVYGYQPSAPLHLKATPGNKKITLGWSAPAATGGGLLGYLVQHQTKPGVWTNVTETTNTSLTVSATNGTASHFRVLGLNGFGDGTPATVGTTARTKPGVPRKLKAKSGSGSVTLTWTKPESNGGATIKKYVVTFSPCRTTAKAHCKHDQVDVAGSKHKLVVKHLVNRTYHFQVRAKNVAGLGPNTKKIHEKAG